jgi:dephospho-CoA kinase
MSSSQSTASPDRILVIGIVGGIGSGKSAVARWVADRDASIAVFDADVAGHRALGRPETRDRLVEAFGVSILSGKGEIDRAALASRVFGSGAQPEAARRRLESIVHPAIQQERDEFLAQLTAAGQTKVLLVDAALLLEAGWHDRCDAIVFVDAPELLRRQRIAARGWSPDELARREASQWPVDRKKSAADFVVDNSGTLDTAGRQLYEYIHQILRSRAVTRP